MGFKELMDLKNYHIQLHELKISNENYDLGSVILRFRGSYNPTNLLIDNDGEIDDI